MATTNGSQSVSEFPATSLCQSNNFSAACREDFFKQVFRASLSFDVENLECVFFEKLLFDKLTCLWTEPS